MLVDFVEFSFTSLGEAVSYDEQGTEFNPNSGCCNGGSIDGLNLKFLSFIHEVVHFVRPGNHVLISTKLWDEGLIGWQVM